ncbi:MAG TPA: peptidoglycan-binding protein [Gaiellaceae bacterium]|nr:peptidoglycan-binding protein [Gaiellaceae bacterium]
MRLRALTALLLLVAVLIAPAVADAGGKPRVAAVQVALQARGLYRGTIDGIRGPMTAAAIRRFQRRARLTVDGIAGPRTRGALGRLARRKLGTRLVHRGRVGGDVVAVQWLTAWHGFPSGTFDGWFGPRTDVAVRLFQRRRGLFPDGIVGPATIRALRSRLPRSPLRFGYPVRAPITDRFGPRGSRFHTGLDFPAHFGASVYAARSGRVVGAGWNPGGYGYLVVLRHGRRTRTLYAHLSRVTVRVGERVGRGARIGRVGATGNATGPHLHFEVRVRGAAVNPLPALR